MQWNVIATCATIRMMGKLLTSATSGDIFGNFTIPFVAEVANHSIRYCKRQSEASSSRQKTFQAPLWNMRYTRKSSWKRDTHTRGRRTIFTRKSSYRSLCEANQCDRSCRRERRRLIYFPMRKWNDKVGKK